MSEYRIHTLAGVITLQVKSDSQFKVDMGLPRLLAAEIPITLCPDDQKVIAQPLEVAAQSWLCHLCQHGESSLHYLRTGRGRDSPRNYRSPV